MSYIPTVTDIFVESSYIILIIFCKNLYGRSCNVSMEIKKRKKEKKYTILDL